MSGMDKDAQPLTAAAIEALAAELNATVEYRSWVQDTEGRWYWSDYAAPSGAGTWNADLYDHEVKVEARIVGAWEPIDRESIRPNR